MKCPRCSELMQARSVATDDPKVRTTNYLCLSCMKRVVRAEPNPVARLEYKSKWGSGKVSDE